MQDERARVNIVITGLVQGVFFRASTLEKAQGLNLSGWVKNQPDGSVEIIAEGERYALEDLVEWCRQGPPGAEVKDVFNRFDQFKDEFKTFTILR
jgi:acylphosphatase